VWHLVSMTSPSIGMPDAFAQPSARTFRLEALVRLVGEGKVRVPHFQRSFRWDQKDVVKLFDSILRGYPIGSVLLWQRAAPADEIALGAMSINAPAFPDALWVVDGQQRITSLVNAVSQDAYDRDERFRLDYDLDRNQVLRHADAHRLLSVPLPVLFDLRRLLGWMSEHPEVGDQIATVNEVAVRLRDFELPASVVAQADQTVLQEIFDRMNNSGKRLRRAEVFSAIFAASESQVNESLSIQSMAERAMVETRFGRIDDDTVLRIILARRGANVARDLHGEFDPGRRPSEEFPGETRDEAFENGYATLVRTVEFVQTRAGVPHFSFLPYRFMLIVLTRFFGHFPDPSERNLELLVRWFWRAALAGPGLFKGSATGAARAFNALIEPKSEDDSVQRLLSAVPDERLVFFPDVSRFRTNEAASRVILCALWSLSPRRPDGAQISGSDLARVLEESTSALPLIGDLLPAESLEPKWRATVANKLMILPSDDLEVVREKLEDRPALFAREGDDAAFFKSHGLSNSAISSLRDGRRIEFLEQRLSVVSDLVARFLAARTGRGLESTPPLSSLNLDDDWEWERPAGFGSPDLEDGLGD
jgi:hypothetical protein